MNLIPQPWWLIHMKAALMTLTGLTIVAMGNPASTASVLGVNMVLIGLLAIRFWQVSKAIGRLNYWFLTNGLTDLVAGLALLLYHTNPTKNVSLVFGLWGVLVGIFGVVEILFLFLVCNPQT